jgi:Kef-type K+ transport system membrane component KefB
MLKIFHRWSLAYNIKVIQQTERTKAGKNRIFCSNMLFQDIMILNMLIVCLHCIHGSAVKISFFPLVAILSFVISFLQGNLHLKKCFLLFFHHYKPSLKK